MPKIVENDNMDPSHEYIREVESGVREMPSEHSLPNMLYPPFVRVKIGVKSIRVIDQQRSTKQGQQ